MMLCSPAIDCHRLSKPDIDFFLKNHSRKQLYFKRKEAKLPTIKAAIGLDELCINGEVLKLGEILPSNYQGMSFVVVTTREKTTLLSYLGPKFSRDIVCLETAYPFISDAKYFNCSISGYKQLLKVISKLEKLNFNEPSLQYNVREKYKTSLSRTLREKSSLDSFFSNYDQSGINEVHVAEASPDETILCFDYNSMYASCMQGKFLSPSHLRYSKPSNSEYNGEKIEPGLYSVKLSKPRCEFIKKFHPFKVRFEGIRFPFEMKAEESVETLLFDEEIEYYQSLFEVIQLNYFIGATKLIDHPLAQKAKVLFKERLSKTPPTHIKHELALLHSISSLKSRVTSRANDEISAVKICIKKSGLSFTNNDLAARILIESGKAAVRFDGQKYQCSMVNFGSSSNIECISAQVSMRCKLKMMKLIKSIHESSFIRLCYSNVDSIHVAVKRKNKKKAMEFFSNYIGREMGQLKFEGEFERGLWIDRGRYWLYSNNSVSKFRNKDFNHPGSVNKFIDKRHIPYCLSGEFFFHRTFYVLTLWRSLGLEKLYYTDAIERLGSRRYTNEEVKNLAAAGNDSSFSSLKIRITKFNELAAE